jgi:hypothetical protein
MILKWSTSSAAGGGGGMGVWVGRGVGVWVGRGVGVWVGGGVGVVHEVINKTSNRLKINQQFFIIFSYENPHRRGAEGAKIFAIHNSKVRYFLNNRAQSGLLTVPVCVSVGVVLGRKLK